MFGDVKMTFGIGIIIGLIVGGLIGVLVMALCVASKHDSFKDDKDDQ